MSESTGLSWLSEKIPLYWRKAMLSATMTGIFVYHRRISCEHVLAERSPAVAFWVSIWVLVVLKEPLALPIGLAVMHLKHDAQNTKLQKI
jgi:hypothetical protein